MYQSLDEMIRRTEAAESSFWETALEEDARESGIPQEASFQKMRNMYLAMKEAEEEYDPDRLSESGMVGSEGAKIDRRLKEGRLLSGPFMGGVMATALKVADSNACMKRIVAAPTAGSCGVVPAVFLNVQRKKDLSDDQMTEALYVAAAIGGVIASRASLAGADGGCQAEIGSASAMAAGGLAHLLGGSARQIADAAALALKGLLGLACDPVAGLVEVPCVKRNVIGAVNAVTSADMAMAGISSVIPPDQVIDAMKSIGHSMSLDLKETGRGGLAATPEGVRVRDRIRM
jgi:L-serine dehydratase